MSTSLEKALERSNSLYSLHGREGLRECSYDEIGLMLYSRHLKLKEMEKDPLTPEKELLSLEIKDITGYVKEAQDKAAYALRKAPPMER